MTQGNGGGLEEPGRAELVLEAQIKGVSKHFDDLERAQLLRDVADWTRLPLPDALDDEVVAPLIERLRIALSDAHERLKAVDELVSPAVRDAAVAAATTETTSALAEAERELLKEQEVSTQLRGKVHELEVALSAAKATTNVEGKSVKEWYEAAQSAEARAVESRTNAMQALRDRDAARKERDVALVDVRKLRDAVAQQQVNVQRIEAGHEDTAWRSLAAGILGLQKKDELEMSGFNIRAKLLAKMAPRDEPEDVAALRKALQKSQARVSELKSVEVLATAFAVSQHTIDIWRVPKESRAVVEQALVFLGLVQA